MIYAQFDHDPMLAKDKLCCALDIFGQEGQKCLYEIISCRETQINKTFSP